MPDSPVFRFAPSPTGRLHLGHAYSALLNQRLAQETDGRFLLRIEDTDVTRCRKEHEEAILKDLAWLGLTWETPVRRQSEHFDLYTAHTDQLRQLGLLYPCFASRSDIARAVSQRETSGTSWPRDPDGSPLYPGIWRDAPQEDVAERIASGQPHAWRIDMAKTLERIDGADLSFEEYSGEQGDIVKQMTRDPAIWGDVVIVRKDSPSSYHLACVVDDHIQGVSDVVRGQDLAQATGLHRLLQHLFGYASPRYRHHALLLDNEGRKLAKSSESTALADLRASGTSAEDVRRRLSFD